AQAAASAPGFTRDREDLSRRPLTTAEVRWIIPPWPSVGAAGPAQRSPDVAPLLREIVSRPDWVPGGAVVFIITGHGRRAARAAENAAGGAAVLELRLAKTAAEVAAQAATAYRLRLVVAEPSDVPPGRVFDVLVQGQPAVTGWRLEGQPRRAVWLDLGRVLLRDRLEVALRASPGSGGPPVLSGLILQAEGAPP
ncbi:MAG: hypothetical protein GX595_06675, partial [Lentisphaerae bacterium]|nr:hypothetical protein [Lentisphaerota bacterium]